MAPGNKILVCEGSCNPDLAEVDHLNIMVQGGRFEARDYTAGRVRALVHTEHSPVRGYNRWDTVTHCWYISYKCAICGFIRRY